MPAKDRSHYRGNYASRARQVRVAAYADPLTRCWRCQRTLPEHPPGTVWHAGHVRDGDYTSPLLPEGSSCNQRAGQARQMMSREPRSQTW